ncbi:MAG: DUF805 domain-containing protein, partial [Pseudomonadota bacterium]
MGKKQISAKEVLADIKDGIPDKELTDKYGLPPASLEKMFKKLMEAGLLTQDMLDDRSSDFTILNDVPRTAPPITSPLSQQPSNNNVILWYLEVLRNYAVFTGRARRKEFWVFYLANIIIYFVLGFVEELLGITRGAFVAIYALAVTIPGIAVMVRRFHDINISGAAFLINLIPIAGSLVV